MQGSTSEDGAGQLSKEQSRQAEFEQVFREHWEKVYSLLFRLTGNRHEAEDLALETFVRFWHQPPAIITSPGGWLYRVAINLGYNALRAVRRRQHYETTAGWDALELNHLKDPPESIELREEQQLVRQVLAGMPPRMARLLLLRSSGLSYNEIAISLQVKPSSVGALLARAEQEFEKRYRQGGFYASE